MILPVSKNRIIYGLCCIYIICFVCAVLMIDSCTSSKERFMSKLRSAIQDASKNNVSTFTMVSVTDFTWDTLFIFGPYTPVSEIEKALGFSWPLAKKSGIERNETFCLLVFLHKNKVVQYFEYPRRDGDFSSISSTNKITPNTAIFSAARGENNWLVVNIKEK